MATDDATAVEGEEQATAASLSKKQRKALKDAKEKDHVKQETEGGEKAKAKLKMAAAVEDRSRSRDRSGTPEKCLAYKVTPKKKPHPRRTCGSSLLHTKKSTST